MSFIGMQISKWIKAVAICWCCLTGVGWARDLPKSPEPFITAALCSRSGDVWLATESGGLLKLPHGAAQWERQQGNNLPKTDSFLSLAEDRQGRIWAGTDNRGVVVWNGKSWARYDQRNALPGERVCALAVSPLNGDVAIATSGGLTIYSPATETWQDFTRANGLPEDQVVSLSFNQQGTLWAAFLTNGIACATPAARYGDWKLVQTRWYWDKAQRVRQPLEARGRGLPSNFCNAIAATGPAVWVGTTSGLGYGRSLSEWKFLRGRDYAAKNEGLWTGRDQKDHRERNPGKQPVRKAEAAQDSSLLPEDYITCFHPVPGGMWVGFREAGVCLVRDPSLVIRETDLKGIIKAGEPFGATCFLMMPDGSLYAGTYGHGLVPVAQTAARRAVTALTGPGRGLVAHPVPPALSGFIGEGAVDPAQAVQPWSACYWYEDWATQGDWCERYGQSYAMLCAANFPIDNVEISSDQLIECIPVRGPHAPPGSPWMKGAVIYENEPGMRSILYCPESTTRTLAVWSDGGEDYPKTFDGPDMGALIVVPDDRHLLSLYFYDPTPLTESDLRNSLRDYIIEIRPMPPAFNPEVVTGRQPLPKGGNAGQYLTDSLIEIAASPVQARSRVKAFAGGGIYKNFILNGKGCYYVRIIRNYSTGASLNGLFLSSLDETKNALKNRNGSNRISTTYGGNIPAPAPLRTEDLKQLPANLLAHWAASQDMGNGNLPGIYSGRHRGLVAYRHLAAMPGLEQLKANWRWRLKIWADGDEQEFARQVASAWDSLQDAFPFYRSKEWSHYASGTTVPFSVDEVKKMKAKGIDWRQYRANSPVKPEKSVEEMKQWLKEH